jgi:copper transport protein
MDRHVWHARGLIALFAAIAGLAVLVLAPGVALAHALPTSYSPAPNATLKTSPPNVTIHFSEHLAATDSELVVVNPSNQEVDNHDSHILPDDLSMEVTLPLLPAGTYVVFWETHSADDGHIVGGSYLFYIERADGTVPPLSGPLPTGHFAGGAGSASAPINGPQLVEALFHWVALVALTLMLGAIAWLAFVCPLLGASNPRERWSRLWLVALIAVLVGTVGEVAAQAFALDGTWQGLVSWPLYGGILFQSRYGAFILARLALALLGLIVLSSASLRRSLRLGNAKNALVLYGLLFAASFVYSGHGGTSPAWWGAPNDFLHLVTNGIWLGGIGVLVLVVLPALPSEPLERARALTRVQGAFAIPALLSVAALAITGPLNANQRMYSFDQLWTTAYGITLLVKIGLFIVMIALSAFHSFRVRPRLEALAGATIEPGDVEFREGKTAAMPAPASGIARWLDQQLARFEARFAPSLAVALSRAEVPTVEEMRQETSDAQAIRETRLQVRGLSVRDLTTTIVQAIRVEAVVGAGLLLCVALLSPLSSTLVPVVNGGAAFGATGGAQTLTQTVDGLHVTLNVSPGHFGTNTFQVTVLYPDGTLASGGSVFLITNMVEMDMGTNQIDLQATSTPGVYSGQGDLSMAGHWRITTDIRTKRDPNTLHTTIFTISASFS